MTENNTSDRVRLSATEARALGEAALANGRTMNFVEFIRKSPWLT